jgi:hypothetical protein
MRARHVLVSLALVFSLVSPVVGGEARSDSGRDTPKGLGPTAYIERIVRSVKRIVGLRPNDDALKPPIPQPCQQNCNP